MQEERKAPVGVRAAIIQQLAEGCKYKGWEKLQTRDD